MRAPACALALALLLLALASCAAKTTMLPAPVADEFAGADAAMKRGDLPGVCERLVKAAPGYAAWIAKQKGDRAARATTTRTTLARLVASCTADPGPLASDWPKLSKQIIAVTTWRSTWLGWFAWVSMFALGLGVFALLRRLKPAS